MPLGNLAIARVVRRFRPRCPASGTLTLGRCRKRRWPLRQAYGLFLFRSDAL